MEKYIKCNRNNGLVMGQQLYDQPHSLCNRSVFWVRVQVTNGQPGPWQRNDPEDHVQFQLYQSLPWGAEQPVVTEMQGQWWHAIDSNDAERIGYQRAERIRDLETHRLIKIWCERQTEGSEEAFINLGIEDPGHHRYQAYREAANEIRQLRK